MTLPIGSRAILASVAIVAIVAACSSGAATTGPTVASTPGATVAATTAPTTAAGTSAPSAAASAIEVDVVTDALGAHITGEAGKTLYLRTSDSTNTTTCTGGCAGNWPPFTLAAGATVTAGTGVTGTLASFARPDGSMQVTINGQPLYYFAGDSAAGQNNGQTLAGVWFVVSPTGTKVG